MSDVSLCALEEKTSSEKELVKSDRNSDSSEKFVRKSIFVAEGVIKLEITDMYNKLSIKTFSESSQPHIFNNTSWTLKFKREFTDDLGVFLLCNEAYQKSTKTLKEENVINMTDIDPDVFVIMLKYAYRASWKFESKAQAVEVLYAADKYMLDELMLHGVGRSSLIIRRNTEHEAILTAA
uniref:BTB domain-containing protein n=1 Tax=Timema monikensis TaxID=170555 RepID=A0A7R9HT85_9NEOP|nr:unnamed protein product [Timema monikensis]